MLEKWSIRIFRETISARSERRPPRRGLIGAGARGSPGSVVTHVAVRMIMTQSTARKLVLRMFAWRLVELGGAAAAREAVRADHIAA